MVKELVHDPMFLAQKSELATEADAQLNTDLSDTFRAHLNCYDETKVCVWESRT